MKFFGIEEFAARRRKAQEDLEAALAEPVRSFFEDGDLDGLEDAITSAYATVYFDESGENGRVPRAFLRQIVSQMGEASSDDPAPATSLWLATAVLNKATLDAAAADGSPILLEWVTMNDAAVRDHHVAAEGQQRPPGEPFDVGGEELLYPGQPGGRPDNVLGCRCAARPTVMDEASLVASDQQPDEGAEMDPEETTTKRPWFGVLAPEGVMSGDGRMFAPNSLRTRDLPLPLTWQKSSGMGHDGSVTVGSIERIERDEAGLLWGYGTMLDTPEADEFAGLMEHFGRYGVSIDADDAEFEFNDADESVVFTSARIAGASGVSIPAFQEAYVALGEGPVNGEKPEQVEEPEGEPAPALNLVASIGLVEAAPADWFKDPEFESVQPLTVTKEGRVFGHIAEFGTCHVGIRNACVNPPNSATDYASFKTGAVLLDDDTQIATGPISVGGGHADGNLGMAATLAHYDQTSTAAADVNIGEDAFGIWVAGWVRPGTTPEMIAALRASAPSGDWRETGGNLELCAVLSVNVPGFPVRRQARVAASNGRQVSLVAAAVEKAEVTTEDFVKRVVVAALDEHDSRRIRREKMAALTAKAKGEH